MKKQLLAIVAGVVLATGITVLAQDGFTQAKSTAATKVELSNPFALQKYANRRDPSTIDWSKHPKQLHPATSFPGKGVLRVPNKSPMREASLPSPIRAFYWDMMSGNPEGLYSFSGDPEAAPELVAQIDMLKGFENGNGRYFGIFLNFGMDGSRTALLSEYNTDDWTLVRREYCDPGLSFTDVAVDPTSGEVYGCYYNPETDGYSWGVANFEAQTRTLIKDLDADYYLYVVACDGDGQYYAIDNTGMILKINKVSGDMETLTSLNMEFEILCGGCFNTANGTIVVVADTDLCPCLAEVNPLTGEASTIFQGSWLTMMQSPYFVPCGNALAPAQPGLEITCPEGAQMVDYVLTMPTELGNGETLQGSVSYTLTVDGEEVLAGNADPGQVIDGNLDIDVNGFVTFVLKVSNEAGFSPVARTVCFVGTGSPAAPQYVNAYHDGHAVNLTWAPVSLSTDDGYIDPALMRYEIKDIDGAVVASDVEGTSYVIPFAIPEHGCVDLQYTVRACYDGKYSEPMSSAKIFVGTLGAPFDLNMDIYNFGRHSVLDVNNDGRTWINNSNRTYYVYGMEDADDWLMSPEFMLEAGKIYPFKATAENLSSGNEVLEIKWGRQDTVEGMTDVIATPTQIDGLIDMSAYLMPQETGLYHVGFHAISPATQGFLGLNSYSIGEPINSTTPASVTDLKVLGAWDGSLKASGTFKAPTTDIIGNPLSKNVDITVCLGNEIIETINGAQPGQSLTVDFDTSLFPEAKYYDFYFITSNEDGTSLPLRYREFVGPKEPANPEIFNITKEDGKFFTTWSPVTKATDGTDILPSNIKYKVHSLERTFVGLQVKDCLTPEPIAETRFQVFPEETDQQELTYFGVQTLNLQTETPYVRYNSYLLGTPYSLPIKYTVENRYPFYELFISDASVYAGWSFLENFASQDEDGNWVGAFFEVPGSQGSIKTGKISLENSVEPVLSFFTYCFGTNSIIDANTTEVIVEADGVEQVIYTVDNSQLSPSKWNRISCDLSPFVGKVIRVELQGKAVTTSVCAWDNIQIRERTDYKFVADATAPSKVSTDIPFDVNIKVLNDGEKDQLKPYSVTLFRNGVEVETKEITEALGAGERNVVTFAQKLGADADEVNEYTAKISYKDGNGATQETSTGNVTVARRILDIPAVQGLHGEYVDGGVSLEWLSAEIDQETVTPVTETFENCESWAKEVYEWTFIDEDKQPVGGFTDFEVPNVTAYTDCVAFLVWDTSYAGSEEAYSAYSGNKLLSTLHAAGWMMQTSDWAISPRLSGDEQTVSFMARILEPYHNGEMAVYYSMDDDPTNVSAFVKCEEFANYKYMDSTEWTEFSATVPSGAKHFAIHSTGSDAFILLLDDVTFVPAAPELVGYNVYCDGVRVNDTPVEEVSFRHVGVEDGIHVYRVNALYDKGASELSEPVSVLASGIIVSRDMMVSVMAQNQAIHIRGAENQAVRIASLDGKVIYTGNGDAVVSVTPDLYMVTVGSTTLKILVR